MKIQFSKCFFVFVSLIFLGSALAQANVISFNFTLPASYTTSAGVYDSKGHLIRTIWSGVKYAAGTYSATWDGYLDVPGIGLTAQPAGAGNYTIKLLYHNVNYVWEGVIGNTDTSFTSLANGTDYIWHGDDVLADLAIDSNNNMYFATGYAEGEANALRAITTAPNSPKKMYFTNNSADEFLTFEYTATDGKVVYFSNGDNGWTAGSFVAGFNASDNSQYNFQYGQEEDRGNAIKLYHVIDDNPGTNFNSPTGLAVQVNGNLLAVSHNASNEVRLFNKTSGALLGSIAVTAPGKVAFAQNGDLWVITGTTVVRYTAASLSGVTSRGTALTIASSISGLTQPMALAVDPRPGHDIILVTDAGITSQQIKAFNSTGTLLWTYGTPGGYYYIENGKNPANGPDVTNSKFAFIDPDAPATPGFITIAPDGSFWVRDAGNFRYLHFSTTTTPPTYLEQIAYLPRNFVSTVDLNNPSRLFTRNWLEYHIDYTKPLLPGDPNGPGGNQSWTLVKNWGVDLPFNFYMTGTAYTAGEGLNTVFTLSNGRTYGLVYYEATDFSRAYQCLVELSLSGPLRLIPEIGFLNYETFNADGSRRRFSDTNMHSTGGIQQIINNALTGFDASGNPIWGPDTIIAQSPSGPYDAYWRGTFTGTVGQRFPITSSGILVSFDQSDLNGGNCGATCFTGVNIGMHLGGVKLGDTVWSWEASPAVIDSDYFENDVMKSDFALADPVNGTNNMNKLIAQGILIDDNLGIYGDNVYLAPGQTQCPALLSTSNYDVICQDLLKPYGQFEGGFEVNDGVHYAGNTVEVTGRNIVYGYHGEAYLGNQANQFFHFYDDGLFVGQFGAPVWAGESNSPAEQAGNSFAQAIVSVNGVTYFYHNDEGCHGGMHRWRLDNINNIAEMAATGAMNSTIYLTPLSTSSAPTVSITAPANGTIYPAGPNGVNITLTVNAVASSGNSIAQVQFFSNGQPAATVTQSPFSVTLPNVHVSGSPYYFTAIATDNTGLTSASSAPISVTVNADVAPTVSLTVASADGQASSVAPANVILTANVTDTGGSGIVNVAFSNGSTLLGTVTSSPYSYTWTNVPAGTYSLTAQATDNSGVNTTSSVSVTVNPAQSVTISTDGSTISAGSTVSLGNNAGTWGFGTATGSGGNDIVLNGKVVGSGVTLLVYNNGQLYAQINLGGWYLWTGATWYGPSGDPRAAGLISTDGSTISAGSTVSLGNNAGTWGFGTATGSGGNDIVLNGKVVGSAVLLLVYNNGQLYANISSGAWYLWNGTGWGNPISGDPRPPLSSLSAPTNLTANVISSSQINLSWTASTGGAVSGYKIFRNGTQVGTSTSVSYSDTGLSASMPYSYTVSAYDATGNSSAFSSPVNVQTPSGSNTADGSTLNAGSSASLLTSAGTWTFSTATGSGGNDIVLNGKVVGSGVTLLVYNHGQLYAKINSGAWYLWSGATWNGPSGDPTAAGLISTDGSTITASSTISLGNSAGLWALGTLTGSGGNDIVLNGKVVGSAVLLLVYNHGQIYAQIKNTNTGPWYLWNGNDWGNPLSGSPDPQVP